MGWVGYMETQAQPKNLKQYPSPIRSNLQTIDDHSEPNMIITPPAQLTFGLTGYSSFFKLTSDINMQILVSIYRRAQYKNSNINANIKSSIDVSLFISV